MIEKCTANDLDTLISICRQTFSETFGRQNSQQDMDEFLDKTYNKSTLGSQLSDPKKAFYFAKDDQKVLGYLQLNLPEAQTEPDFPDSLEIQRIYIINEAKGRRLGSDFMDLAFQRAKELGLSYIWLGVWEYNFPVQKFYLDKGFHFFSSHEFILGQDRQKDLLMKKSVY